MVTINGVAGTATVEFQVNGDAATTGNTTIGGTTNAQVVNATTVNASAAVNTPNLGGVGGSGLLTLTSDLNAGVTPSPVRNITGGAFTGYTLNNGQINVGATLTNNGIINGGSITNAAITGGSINNTPIGGITPNTGAFTTLTSSGNSTIGTGANLYEHVR